MFSLAHITDPHVGPLPPMRMREFLGKRITGWVNWRRGRRRTHDMEVLGLILADLVAQAPDHIACTGDLVNLGLRDEFPAARAFLERLGNAESVSFVPGNHDAYVRSAFRNVESQLWPWMTSDDGRYDGFPYVRLRGPVAIVGLSTAVPTAPFVASGRLGREQVARFNDVLAFLKGQNLARVVMIHHPPHRAGAPPGRNLTDAGRFEAALAAHGADLVLHGHNHKIEVAWLPGPDGPVPIVGAPSASSGSPIPMHRACYHLFSFDMTESGVTFSARTRGLDAEGIVTDLGPLDLAAPSPSVVIPAEA